jgi:tetratricopeptide (TPR) repeat protein
MTSVRGKIFCQRCRTPNELGEELCSRCGTRLMLLVEPTAARFEGRAVSTGMEEHLLERITSIENNISRLIDKLEQMAELMLKQSRSAYFDHALLDTIVTVLTESGVIDRRRLRDVWREKYKKDDEELNAIARGGDICENVLAAVSAEGDALKGLKKERFFKLVREGFADVSKGKTARGVRSLELAVALAQHNAPLLAFLGEHFYGKGKTALARGYLARAVNLDPDNSRTLLLLGLAFGDAGKAGQAREFLSEAVRRGGPSFAAHCALGRLSAAESDWKAALAEFKRALDARPCPEAHYLLGLVNYNLGRDRAALRHLSKAVGLDADYGAAFYLRGLVYQRLGDRRSAAREFKAARTHGCGVPRRGDSRDETPSLFVSKGPGRRRLVTGGDERLADALREDALGNRLAR